MTIALYIAACAFALAHGTNTGSTLLSMGLTIRSLRPALALFIMMLGVALAPVLLGTAVATTLAGDLVGWDADSGAVGMLTAVITSIVVVFVLGWFGIPTGLTLALLGGIAGFGFASGDPVAWPTITVVLVLMALAPVVGGIGSAVLIRVIAPVLRWGDAGRTLRGTHIGAFTILAVAYGANDAQKMLAVFSVAAGAVSGAVPLVWWQLCAAAALFGLGTALGLGRMARTISTGVMPVRTLDAVATEVSTAGAMLTSSLFGAPVGLAQTLSGSLVGCGLTKGVGRIRWQTASKVGAAWVATLPAAFLISAAVGAVVSRV